MNIFRGGRHAGIKFTAKRSSSLDLAFEFSPSVVRREYVLNRSGVASNAEELNPFGPVSSRKERILILHRWRPLDCLDGVPGPVAQGFNPNQHFESARIAWAIPVKWMAYHD